jgi:hypothetical protein
VVEADAHIKQLCAWDIEALLEETPYFIITTNL